MAMTKDEILAAIKEMSVLDLSDLVKTLEERMARELVRWHPDLSITALRFSNVMVPEDYAAFPRFDEDARARKWNLWGYIDRRDGGHAVERALAALV